MTYTYRDLFGALAADGEFDAGAVEAELARAEEAEEGGRAATIVGAVGAWIVAGFGLLLLALLGFVDLSPASLITALVLAGSASAAHLDGCGRGAFGGQLVLAASFAAQVATLTGALEGPWPVWLAAVAVVSGVLYVAIDTTANRLASFLFFAIVTTVTALGKDVAGLATVFFAASVVIVGLGFGAEKLIGARAAAALRPAAYGAALACLGLTVEAGGVFFYSAFPDVQRVLVALVAAAMLSYAHLERGGGRAPLFAVASALVVLGLFTTPGVLFALLLVGLGIWRGRSVVAGLGAAGLLVHLIIYYYSLDTTLLAKSGILVGSGLVLLFLRALAFRGADGGLDD